MSLDKLGKDEWVSQIGERRRQQNPVIAAVTARWQQLPRLWQIVLLLAFPVALPLLVSNDYILRLGGLVWLFSILSFGLNVVVGYAGLLDLGYVAFFGMGGYAYAFMSSAQFGVHAPSWVSVPLVTLITIILGFLLGLPSLRLRGDYLAIVTLGFGQIFLQLARTMDRVSVPWSDQPLNITGGPNGIPGLDPISLFGFQFRTVTHYYYLLLAVLVLVVVFMYRIDRSRLGRAWRAIREDVLAAGAMGIPSNRLQLIAFATGAGVAGLCGAIFAAWQQAIFPQEYFDTPGLIMLYAMVVLGGVGSLPGMIVGAFVLIILPEVLQPNVHIPLIPWAELNQLIFYGGTLALLVAVIRPRRRLILMLAALVAGGVIIRLLAAALVPGAIGEPVGSGLSRFLARYWLPIPDNAMQIGNLAFFVVVGMVVLLTRLPKNMRPALVVVTLYLLAFVWETRLSQEPSTTRVLFIGAALIALMIYRPQGIFGKRRVEVM